MKTIGMIGGMSPESTMTYYKIINDEIKERLGGFHSAKILLYSVDFSEIEACQSKGMWDETAKILGEIAVKLEQAGADFILICTNTMHKVADQVQDMIHIPLLHIAEATAKELVKNDIQKVALLGTKYTMQQNFYKDKLIQAGLSVIIPEETEMQFVNEVIFQELCKGIVSEKSKQEYLAIIKGLQEKGAQAVILGCTEIGMLIQKKDTELPVFDTAVIHANHAVELALV